MAQKNRLTAYLMLLIYITPMLVGYCLYIFRDHFRFNSVCHGELLNPPIELENFMPNLLLPGKWQMITIRPDVCDTLCENHLDTLKKIHIALGKDQSRVKLNSLLSKDLENIHDSSNIINVHKTNLLIVDPNGWIILHYSLPFNLNGVLQDIRRLLKYSHVG